jgi:hypothetical protein
MSLIKNAFPNYDDVLPMLEGFVDVSYKNDVCPSISKSIANDINLILYCDYKDKALRDDSDGFRYCLCLELPMLLCNAKVIHMSDDILEIKNMIDTYTLADYINMPTYDYDVNQEYY